MIVGAQQHEQFRIKEYKTCRACRNPREPKGGDWFNTFQL